jgi:hypothetical protein
VFIWCAILFLLGIVSFLDALLTNNQVFGQLTSVFFMLISLGLLIRTTTKLKQGKLEQYEKRIFSLEQQVNMLKAGQEKLSEY